MAPIYDITGLDIEEVVRALWENQRPAAFFASGIVPAPPFQKSMDPQYVKMLADYHSGKSMYLDYVCGRCIKTSFAPGKPIDLSLYNRDAPRNGELVLDELKKKKKLM